MIVKTRYSFDKYRIFFDFYLIWNNNKFALFYEDHYY